MSCDRDYRYGSDPELHRLPAAALISTLAWQLPYATGAALKSQKNKTKKNPKASAEKVMFWSYHWNYSLFYKGACPPPQVALLSIF